MNAIVKDKITSRMTLISLIILLASQPVYGWYSDGSDGPFHPTGSITLEVPPGGIFNFTTIQIPDGVVVKFNALEASSPVIMLATGDITIGGVFDVSGGIYGSGYGHVAGPGGFNGGAGGGSDGPGSSGFGPNGGIGGVPRHPGGGGGFATSGDASKTDGCLTSTTPGGTITPYTVDLFEGGSGGGGGGGGAYGTAGCNGGGGGGVILLSTPGVIEVRGQVLANGGGGTWCYTSALCGIRGGPGGGGAGGLMILEGDTILLDIDGLLSTEGGLGGVKSSDGSLTPFGGNGGYGYVSLLGTHFSLAGSIVGIMAVNNCIADRDHDFDTDGYDIYLMAEDLEPPCLDFLAAMLGDGRL